MERILDSKWSPSPERRTEQDSNKSELVYKQVVDRMGADLQTLTKVYEILGSSPHDIEGLEHVITTSQSIFRSAHFLQKKEFERKAQVKKEAQPQQ